MYLKEKTHQVIISLRKNVLLWFLTKFIFGLLLVYSIYFLVDKHYVKKLESGLNCFCKADSVFIDKTNYLDQIGFTFTIHTGEQIRYLSPINVDLKRFDYSRIYTVRYLCEEYKYNELILEDWDENKYVKNEKNQYLLK